MNTPDTSVSLYTTPEQDSSFKDWMHQHPHGFYLNERAIGIIRRGEGEMVLHRVGCHYLSKGEGLVSTTYAKAASEDIQALTAWAEQNGLTIANCSSCKPDRQI